MPVEEQFLIIGMIYFVPTITAWLCSSAAISSIFFLNLVFGWTGLGWLACWIILIIAPNKKQAMANVQRAAYNAKVGQARDEFYLHEQAKHEAMQQSPVSSAPAQPGQ